MNDTSTLSMFSAVFLAIVLLLGLAVVPAMAQDDSGSQTDSETQTYAVIQGESCTTVTPLGIGAQSIENFYDYRTPETEPSSSSYSSFGTQHLQEADTSNLFFYRGTDGVSLVFLHGQMGDSAPGAVTMEITGIPEDGEWVVQDDNYAPNSSGGPTDEFNQAGSASRITWVFAGNRTDGGALQGGLQDDFRLRIDPGFNDNADFDIYDSDLTEWRLVSDDWDGLTNTTLNMDQRITIQPGPCSSFAVSQLNVTENPSVGEPLTIEATILNDGAQPKSFDVPFVVDGEVVDQREVTLESGAQQTVTSSVTLNETDTYDVGVGNETTQVTFGETDSQSSLLDPDGLPTAAYGIAVVAVALLALTALAVRRR